MTTFNLTTNGKTYAINTDGSVTTTDGPFGNWSTNTDNQIVIKKSGGTTTLKIDVDWKFNASNQLCIQQGGQDLFNFASGGARPRYRMADNVLQVRASADYSFEFALHCKWELDTQINMKATIGKVVSILDGWVDDKKSRFIYWFNDKQAMGAPYALEFSGAWERDDTNTKEIRLIFKFQTEGVKGTFSLPSKAIVDATRNHLYLEYQKSGITRRIEMRGSLEISDNFDLIFTISQQTNSAGGVITKETRIEVETTFKFDNLSGSLELFVGKTVTTTTQKLVIRGAFKISFGDNGLDLNFSYSKSSTGSQPPVVAIALSGSFSWNQGKGVLSFSYQKEGSKQSLTIQTNFMLGDVRAEAGLNITKDGKEYGVYGFLGLSW